MITPDVGDLPPEFAQNPLALVTLVGLDVANSTIHRAIWESFNANRSDRTSLNLKLIPEGHEFPAAKQKRTSYDWYVPKGILKRNWMNKHMSEVPAVAIQFVDLDWDTPAWLEKRTECATKLQTLRTSLQGRSTRIALVLIQKRAAIPGTDDQLASERAAFLCSSCDLSGKTLFVLPHSDHLFGYTLRLQNAFCELAQTYYHHESRLIKNHRDHLNKTTHQLLFVRHQFKIAFLSELKQEISTALKNYKQAYANLMEVRATDANMLEIKTIAGFINYKMCKLAFLSAAPLDAIAQFRKHIDIFKNKVGAAELAFEHSGWMSKQFSHFGDLFEEAVQQGLNAIQTQHPGFYYQQAANHAMARKSLCLKLCKSVVEASDPDILAGADSLEFFGQRPWRPCCQSLEPPDPVKELEGIQAIKYKELQEIDHSMIIIPFLSSAVSQFKKYRCLRMKRQLMVEMGEEYFYYKDYDKALTLLKHVLWDYRVEKWRPIVSSILWTTLKCAYLSANVHEYLFFALEVISYWMLRNSEEKAVIQQSIANVFQGNPPGPFPTISEQEVKEVEKTWTKNLALLEYPSVLTIPVASVVPFVECKAGFECRDYIVDQRVSVKVHIRMNCPQPMTFSKLTVLFNNSYYNKFCEVPAVSLHGDGAETNDVSSCKISLVPRNVHTYNFSFVPDPNDIGNDIQITCIALQLGNEDSLATLLHWSDTGAQSLSGFGQFMTKAGTFSDDPSFQHICSESSAKILPRNAKILLDIEHETPALIDEFYVFAIHIVNEESSKIRDVTLSVGLKPGQPQIIHESTHLSEETLPTTKFTQYLSKIDLPEMAPGEKITKKIYMNTNAIGVRNVLFEVNYGIDIELDEQLLTCSCKKLNEIEIDVVEPFEFSVKICNTKCQDQINVRAEEPFLLRLDIVSCSEIPVVLVSASLELAKDIYSADGSLTSVVENLSLNPQEAATECFCLTTQSDCPASASVGIYRLKWRRESSMDDFAVVETLVNLSAVTVIKPPIFMELDHPAHGWVCTLMTVTYYLHNRLSVVQDVEILVDGSLAFIFSGNKQMHFRILPREKYKLTYNLYPLVSGYVPLPKLRMTLNPQTSSALSVDELVQDMVPTHIFVMPQGKGNIDRKSN